MPKRGCEPLEVLVQAIAPTRFHAVQWRQAWDLCTSCLSEWKGPVFQACLIAAGPEIFAQASGSRCAQSGFQESHVSLRVKSGLSR